MFEVTIGPHTTHVECPLLETMAAHVALVLDTVERIETTLNEMQGHTPKVTFTIGPVSEQE